MFSGSAVPVFPNYRRGNNETSLYPLNDYGFHTLLDNNVDLNKATDPNCVLGTNGIRIASPPLDNKFLFADSSQEASVKPAIGYHKDLIGRIINMPLNDITNTIEANLNPELEAKKKRRDNKASKKGGVEIDVENLPGYIGENSIEDILKELEPERELCAKAAKKKNKKAPTVRKKASEIDIEVDVELDHSPPLSTQLDNEVSTEIVEDKLPDDSSKISNSSSEEFIEENVKTEIDDVFINNNEKSSEVLKTPSEVEDEKYEELLHQSWERFIKKYSGRIYVQNSANSTKEPKKRIDISRVSQRETNFPQSNKKGRKHRLIPEKDRITSIEETL